MFLESVQSWVSVLLCPILVTGTKIARGLDHKAGQCSWKVSNPIVHQNFYTQHESVQSWSRHQNCKRMDWYTGYQHKFMSIKSMSLLKPGATRCHGTRIARGVPLPVYINLDLYSGFWCTSRCVVFKYSVPPLTDQALRKVLLTS